ncbi:MAG TPA: DNA polymerase III subunit alpha [Treponemataceae bacterium]|jgi:DNA polymerase-3 subunit alpha|nr:DNA polymerase III subunit alpha [Treponemataceae bacterium]HPX13073.1 DNA polymerase III subunit alpha [Treponemataceae bacterium]HQF73374.1 DNA polymerase III subunit alpha [Treponemataceae bacterium]HRR02435.1 DNA polymerase III subunit alpha [Treponemataceae bacterium]
MQDFVHLHVHTDFSLLDGASSYKKMIARAVELGHKALAITDHGNMFGVLRFYQECVKAGIKPLIGSEFYVAPGDRRERAESAAGIKYYHLILIAKNAQGYENLKILSSLSFTEGMYYKPRIDEELLARHHEGIICLSACLAGELPVLLLAGKIAEAEETARRYRAWFGDDYYIELQDHGIEEQKKVAPLLIALARRLGIPMVVTNDAHYSEKRDHVAQDILLCVGTKKTRNDPNRMRFEGAEFYLKTADEMAALFPEYPEMISNTVRIAESCNLEIPQPGPLLPEYAIPPEFPTKEDYFRHLVMAGLKDRYTDVTDDLLKRAEYELDIIIKMDFVGYFLIVWDFIAWAKEHDIPVGPGRGSGAGSIVAYALRITDIEPLRYGLLFERFLNPERVSMPDFDIDFCFERRQEVIEYVREKYGDDRVAYIITFGTLKPKAAIKDVARVLDIPLPDVNRITKLIPGDPKTKMKDAFEANPKIQGSGQLAPLKDDPRFNELFEIATALEGANRNTSLHAAGIVIGKTKLTDYVPLYKDSKTGKIATQFTMDLIEQCGLVKMDFLGLKTLTLIRRTENLIRKRGGKLADFTIESIDEADPLTFRMLGEGKSAAVFQFESQGMQNILKRAKPDKIEDLIALNALYRPGPMAYIDNFIESKFDPSKIQYPDPCLKDILEETYGVIVYQEQVMQVAQRIAGYSLGQADLLRRAMGKKKQEVMEKEKVNFRDGAVKKGFSAADADRIFEILIPFAGYGFNKSHAAAYSVLAYQTAWLKANFPAEFIAANLTNEISSVDKLPEYIDESRKMGLVIDPPDVNRSEALFTVVDGKIVYGLLGIKGLGEQAAEMIVQEREENGPYSSFLDFLDRVDLRTVNKRALEVLIQTGSFDNLGQFRSTLLTNLERAMEHAAAKKDATKFGQVSLFEDSGVQEFVEFVFDDLPDWPKQEKLRTEKDLLGFYISGHPLDDYRKSFERATTLDLAHIDRAREEKLYTVVGMIRSVRPYQTKAGKWMGFGSFEDFNGTIDLTFFPSVWEKCREKALPDTVWGITGKVDFSRENPGFLVEQLIDPDELEEKSVREVHIELDPVAQDEKDISRLRDFLFESSGNCSVYLHLETPKRMYTVKAATQIQVAPDDDFMSRVADIPCVLQVWKE